MIAHHTYACLRDTQQLRPLAKLILRQADSGRGSQNHLHVYMRSFADNMFATPVIADQLTLGAFADGLDKQHAYRNGLRLPCPADVTTSSSACSATGISDASTSLKSAIWGVTNSSVPPIYSRTSADVTAYSALRDQRPYAQCEGY